MREKEDAVTLMFLILAFDIIIDFEEYSSTHIFDHNFFFLGNCIQVHHLNI